MNELNPYAIFVGASFVVGFVARAAIGGYRKITSNKTVEEEPLVLTEVEEPLVLTEVEEPLVLTEKDMVETVEISGIPDIDKDAGKFKYPNINQHWPTLVNPYIPRTEPKEKVSDKDVDAKFRMANEGIHEFLTPIKPIWYDPQKSQEDALKRLAEEHESKSVHSNPVPIIAKPPIKIRILPPAKNHEVFGHAKQLHGHTFKSVERYYYNAIVRGEEEKGPQLLAFSPTVHRKIVEAFTKPEDDDVSNLITGCDLHLYTVDQFEVRLDKGDRRPAGNPTQVESWLKRTADLSNIRVVQEQEQQKRPNEQFIKELKAQAEAQSDQDPFVSLLKGEPQTEEVAKKKSKVVSFNLETLLYEDLRAEAKRREVTASSLLAEILKQHLWEEETDDEAGERQFHFSKNEMVRIADPLKVFEHTNFTSCVWQCPANIKHNFDRRWWNGMKPEKGDRGEVIGFVMNRDKNNQLVPYDEGVAVVHLRKGINVVVRFSGLESIDNGSIQNSFSDLRVGDWTHWQTQAGHTSIRPSVVFKVRKQKRGNEVQLGYVQKNKIVRFWTPASKCRKKLKDAPQGFTGLLAHQLPDAVLAEKLRVL